MLIPHPLLGLRDAQEFSYLGDATLIDRPAAPAPDAAAPAGAPSGAPPDDEPGPPGATDLAAVEAAFCDYVFLRDNPAGVHRELWYHEQGDRSWLVVTRDTVTHEILGAELARDVALARRAGDGAPAMPGQGPDREGQA